MTTIAWHYTTGDKAKNIRASGFLMATLLEVSRDERPIIWFSASQRFEPTARRQVTSLNGKPRLMTMQDMAEMPEGLWRFGVPVTDLLDWRKLKRAAHIPPDTKRALEMAASALGARPDRWFGSLEPIALAACMIQVFDVAFDAWRDGSL